MNDMKTHIRKKEDDWFYYPDVMVNCDPAGQQNYYCDTPSVIVEVMSPTTERIDRREKLMAYELIPSLHTYVLVSQERREVTIHRRAGDDWTTVRLPENGDALRGRERERWISFLPTMMGTAGSDLRPGRCVTLDRRHPPTRRVVSAKAVSDDQARRIPRPRWNADARGGLLPRPGGCAPL